MRYSPWPRRSNAKPPERTAAHICQILAATHGWAPNERTIQRHFRRIGMTRRSLTTVKVAFGRFEATRTNELWVGDAALHGPIVGRHKAILFAFLDDHSRAFTGYRWATAEDTVRAEAALRAGLSSRGLPEAVLNRPGIGGGWSALGIARSGYLNLGH